MHRSDWHELPPGTRDAVEEVVGPVVDTMTVSAGLNSALAATLRLHSGSKVFAKGLRTDQRGVVTQDREALIAPYLGEVAPPLIGQVVSGQWNILLFQHIDARHADYSPGSADIQRAVDLVRDLGQITLPEGLALKFAEQRWSSYIDDESDRALLRGDALLHTDYNPHNVLVTDADAFLIDWAWPTRGAAWIDPACLVVRLIAAGNTAAEAEKWVDQIPAWAEAEPNALDVFSRGTARMWDEIAGHDPVDWKSSMAAAARTWLDHRESSLTSA
ncbi:phosphotransferase [Umezawaea sp. Da 62-37]|uniref:phosphotransferase n=1 Tax=Umezawaea sp. Da 62-37 TaxID=3075927 RepID=UPI0028F704AD|nr:phosphotransferase [Umezawaea sp. Da 62-37]WNV82244.1 phosphotransferase [Umezawaea sp. Da 62-37]